MTTLALSPSLVQETSSSPSDILPAVAVAPDRSWVRVGPYRVPRRPVPGLYTPRLSGVAHLTLDQRSFELLVFAAEAILQGAPCLLEGPTAASKTSIVLLLAALTNHDLLRLNLHGQSTADDLLGRYVPGAGHLEFDAAQLLECQKMLHPRSVALLKRVRSEGRELRPAERLLLAAREGLTLSQWIFQEGPIPLAMRRGCWVVIDEMNLTESQVLESLNPVLEPEPSLVLPHRGGVRFGPGGDVPVHPDFRMLATMNPAGYVGRSPLSSAFRNRWRFTKASPPPSECDYRQMLFSLVFGEHPTVEFESQKYRGIEPPLACVPTHAGLARVPGMEEFLERLATLHYQVALLSEPQNGKPPALGAQRRDRYTFTRRDLLTVLDLLRSRMGNDCLPGQLETLKSGGVRALESVYLSRLDQGEDRRVVTELLRAQNLDRQQWNIPLTASPGNNSPG